jgi:hypothetical protein
MLFLDFRLGTPYEERELLSIRIRRRITELKLMHSHASTAVAHDTPTRTKKHPSYSTLYSLFHVLCTREDTVIPDDNMCSTFCGYNLFMK